MHGAAAYGWKVSGSNLVPVVAAGEHEASLEPPEQVIDQYLDVVGDDGKFPMPYNEIENGGSYCVAKGSTSPQVVIGGMFFWEVDGECVTPPVNDAGESCCEVFMWQPNTAGIYYENCSMKCAHCHTTASKTKYYTAASFVPDLHSQQWHPSDPTNKFTWCHVWSCYGTVYCLCVPCGSCSPRQDPYSLGGATIVALLPQGYCV